MKNKIRMFVFFFVIIATLASASSIFMTILKFQKIPFPWDPAAYACDGLVIARDLRAGDIISLIGDTYRLGFRPFFHPWLLAPAFILFGNTYASARVVSLFCFVLFIPIVYWTGLEMSRRHGHWIGLITIYLALTSSPFLVLSSMCMEEIPGLLMTFVTFLFYLKATIDQKSHLLIWTSLFMALTLFTKWHHGVFVIFAVFLTQLTSNRKLLSRNNLSLFLPFLLVMLGWFIYPRHISSFFVHSTFQPHYYRFFSLENLLYYPRSFLEVYHSSIIVAIVVAVSFLYSLRYIKDHKSRLLAAHVLIGIVLMTIKLDNRHRYILTIVPSIWILGAGQIVEFIGYLQIRLISKKVKTALASIGILGISTISYFIIPKLYKQYPDSLQKYEFNCDERQNKAYEFIARNVGDHSQIAVYGSWDYYNSLRGSTIRWNIEVERDKDKFERNNENKMAYNYFAQMLKKRNKNSYHNFIRFLENKNVRVMEGHLLSFMKILNLEDYQKFRKKTEINPFSDKIREVDSLDANINCLITICREGEEEFNSYANQFMKKQEEWKELIRKEFVDLGITVTIYER